MRTKRVTRPNAQQCEGCASWDDVNGCWANVKDVDNCPRINDDGYYGDEEELEDWEILK